jgi:CheY-like chemotaxis protein
VRILVVDDEADITELLDEVLRRLGHQVDVVSEGRAALARAATTSYDALVLDVRMQGLSGIEVFGALRGQHSPLADRTLFICADLNPEIRACIASLGRPVISKPFRLEAFGEFLRTLAAVAPEERG